MYADAFKALAGAIFVDQGPQAAYGLVRSLVTPRLNIVNPDELLQFQHPKVVLTDILAKDKAPPAEYRCVPRLIFNDRLCRVAHLLSAGCLTRQAA